MDPNDIDDSGEHIRDEGARDGPADGQDDVGFAVGRAPEDCAGLFAGGEVRGRSAGEETVFGRGGAC